MTKHPPVPRAVYEAAVRIYLDSQPETIITDADAVDRWAAVRWPGAALPRSVDRVVFWVLSAAVGDGHEGDLRGVT